MIDEEFRARNRSHRASCAKSIAACTCQDFKSRNELQVAVYSWLGFWRNKFPAEAVTGLQDILGPLHGSPDQGQEGEVTPHEWLVRNLSDERNNLRSERDHYRELYVKYRAALEAIAMYSHDPVILQGLARTALGETEEK